MQVSASGANDADHVRRAYRVVGFLEGRDARHFRLALERIEFDEGVASPGDVYLFHDAPRG